MVILQLLISTRNGLSCPDPSVGDNPVGTLFYTPSGYVSANLASADPALRPNLTYPDPANDTSNIPEWALVGKHTIAYAGPFTVIKARRNRHVWEGQLMHGPFIVANQPSWMGIKVYRNFTLYREADVLKITARNEQSKVENVLFWRRLGRRH